MMYDGLSHEPPPSVLLNRRPGVWFWPSRYGLALPGFHGGAVGYGSVL